VKHVHFIRKEDLLSHISKIELEITDLESLKAACKRLGFTFQEYQKAYQWYGRWVGDTKLPEGILESDLGKCDHAIKVPDCLYEIGVVRKGTKYLLLWDSWHKGGLEKKIGAGACVLKQSYAVERVKREALRKKYRICEQNINNTIRLVLMV
jgi:hypothetical protein